jgi:Zn-dependent protease
MPNDTLALGRLTGIPVVAHGTTLILIVFAYASFSQQGLVAMLTWGTLFAVLLIGSILLHELGHTTAARKLGAPVHRIVLHGFGGFAEIEMDQVSAGRRALVIAAGPFVTALIWLAALGVGWSLYAIFAAPQRIFVPDSSGVGQVERITSFITITDPTVRGVTRVFQKLAWINLAMLILNVLPIVPLDGGQLALLGAHSWLTPRRAAIVVAVIGCLFSSLVMFSAAQFGIVLFVFGGMLLIANAGDLLAAIKKHAQPPEA